MESASTSALPRSTTIAPLICHPTMPQQHRRRCGRRKYITALVSVFIGNIQRLSSKPLLFTLPLQLRKEFNTLKMPYPYPQNTRIPYQYRGLRQAFAPHHCKRRGSCRCAQVDCGGETRNYPLHCIPMWRENSSDEGRNRGRSHPIASITPLIHRPQTTMRTMELLVRYTSIYNLPLFSSISIFVSQVWLLDAPPQVDYRRGNHARWLDKKGF
ncbi:hypothetical protein BJ508DRAFT_22374 [Ascobolus immersus RN42]|uniref:Uncharacterized protein n=1 Tax=Ascobolus immersus RN42 TaxID=1160509 RepID=A0A3N4HND9_ASCIM|nr:hypothetical protein BJ508DRAFT_22374 [Ascobolus immersus RN42]